MALTTYEDLTGFQWSAATGDANYRTWCQAVHDALAGTDLVQTADTGQINLATVTEPGANAQNGYEIWRFDDAEQGSRPIFIRIGYGVLSIGSGESRHCFWLTVGPSTDGAGVVASPKYAETRIAGGSGTNVVPIRAATDEGYFMLDMTQNTGSDTHAFVWIERSRDADGDPTSESFAVYTNGASGDNGSVIDATTSTAASGGPLAAVVSSLGLTNPASGELRYLDVLTTVGAAANTRRLGGPTPNVILIPTGAAAGDLIEVEDGRIFRAISSNGAPIASYNFAYRFVGTPTDDGELQPPAPSGGGGPSPPTSGQLWPRGIPG